MIAMLRGQLFAKSPEAVIVDVNGVGYHLQISLNSYCQLPSIGEKVCLDVHTHVREDQFTLIGFLIPSERDLFQKLITISGIGPRLALNILSGILPDELIDAIRRGDVKRLQTLPGVGKRTSERIVVELKDRLAAISIPPTMAPRPTPSSGSSVTDDLVLALTTLGYKKQEIDRVLEKVRIDSSTGLEQAIKDALRLLQPSR